MKKSVKLIDLDCANCAAKIEDAVKKNRRRNQRQRQLYGTKNDFGSTGR